jgi:phage-related protein
VPGLKRITVSFFATEKGSEPVRDWLKQDLSAEARKLVGEDIKTVEFGWPVGMPTCRSLGGGLHEVRTNLPNRIARVIFYVDVRQWMILLHGFIKKSPQTSPSDIRLAGVRRAQHAKGLGP